MRFIVLLISMLSFVSAKSIFSDYDALFSVLKEVLPTNAACSDKGRFCTLEDSLFDVKNKAITLLFSRSGKLVDELKFKAWADACISVAITLSVYPDKEEWKDEQTFQTYVKNEKEFLYKQITQSRSSDSFTLMSPLRRNIDFLTTATIGNHDNNSGVMKLECSIRERYIDLKVDSDKNSWSGL